MQNYASEIDWLRKKVSENPSSMLHTRLAERFLLIKEVDRAVELAEKGVILHPLYPTARYVLAKCFYERQQYDLANKSLKETLAVDPRHPAALNLSSEMMKRLGDLDQLRANLNQLLEIDPIDDRVSQKLSALDQREVIGTKTEQHEPYNGLVDGTLEEDWDLNISDRLKERERKFADLSADKIGADQSQGLTTEMPPSQISDNPFEDFGQEIEARSAEKLSSSAAPSDFRQEEVLDETIDSDFEIDPSKYKEEENKFTELLDTIFSPGIDEEEQRAEEERSAIERIVKKKDLNEPRDVAPKSTRSQEPQFPEERLSPEEKILKNGLSGKQKLDFPPEIESVMDDEDILPDEFMTFDDEMDRPERPNVDRKTTDEPFTDPPQASPGSMEEDFSKFLAGLDIRDEPPSSVSRPNDVPSPGNPPAPPKITGFDFLSMGLPDIDEEMDEDEEDFPLQDEADLFMHGMQHADQRDQQTDAGDADRELDNKSGRQKGKFFTPTLGEIYTAQGQYAKAIAVFETLIKNNPENSLYKQKLEYLRKKLDEQQNQ
jgi:tetratricopeptide (TPR) repeat protein